MTNGADRSGSALLDDVWIWRSDYPDGKDGEREARSQIGTLVLVKGYVLAGVEWVANGTRGLQWRVHLVPGT